MATDKPKVHSTAKDVEPDATPEPFVYMTKANKRVTFPDIFDMEWEEAETFLLDMEHERNSVILKKWLSEKDLEALKAEKLTLRSMGTLLTKVMAHYEAFMGAPGEDTASES